MSSCSSWWVPANGPCLLPALSDRLALPAECYNGLKQAQTSAVHTTSPAGASVVQGHMVRAWYMLALPAALLLVLRCGASAGACAGGSTDATGACTSAEVVPLGARALRVPLAQLGQPGRPGAPSLLRRAHREAPARLLVRFRPAAVADGAAREYTLHEVEARVEALDGIDLGRFLPGARIAVVTLAPGADADEAVARLSLLHGERPTLETPAHVGSCARRQALLRSLQTQFHDPQRLLCLGATSHTVHLNIVKHL